MHKLGTVLEVKVFRIEIDAHKGCQDCKQIFSPLHHNGGPDKCYSKVEQSWSFLGVTIAF